MTCGAECSRLRDNRLRAERQRAEVATNPAPARPAKPRVTPLASIPPQLRDDWLQEQALARLEGREVDVQEFYRQHAPYHERVQLDERVHASFGDHEYSDD